MSATDVWGDSEVAFCTVGSGFEFGGLGEKLSLIWTSLLLISILYVDQIGPSVLMCVDGNLFHQQKTDIQTHFIDEKNHFKKPKIHYFCLLCFYTKFQNHFLGEFKSGCKWILGRSHEYFSGI